MPLSPPEEPPLLPWPADCTTTALLPPELWWGPLELLVVLTEAVSVTAGAGAACFGV